MTDAQKLAAKAAEAIKWMIANRVPLVTGESHLAAYRRLKQEARA